MVQLVVLFSPVEVQQDGIIFIESEFSDRLLWRRYLVDAVTGIIQDFLQHVAESFIWINQ